MSATARTVTTLLLAGAMLAAPAAGRALGQPAADPSQKAAIDGALARARTTSECLTAGRRYQSLGLTRDAKLAVDRGASMAKAASEWHSIASSYEALGYKQLADEALSKAQKAPMR